jgi:hypothetical protein
MWKNSRLFWKIRQQNFITGRASTTLGEEGKGVKRVPLSVTGLNEGFGFLNSRLLASTEDKKFEDRSTLRRVDHDVIKTAGQGHSFPVGQGEGYQNSRRLAREVLLLYLAERGREDPYIDVGRCT